MAFDGYDIVSRDNTYFYNTEDIVVFPSSNSQDEGKLTLEENVREITTRIVSRNYIVAGFELTNNGNSVTVSEGSASIQGYNVSTISSITCKLPPSRHDDILIMTLAKDGSDHVVGDVKDGDTITFAGVYITYYDIETVEKNFDKIVILGYLNYKDNPNDDPNDPNDDFLIDSIDDDRNNKTKFDAEDIQIDALGRPSIGLDSYIENFKYFRYNELTNSMEPYEIREGRSTDKTPSYDTNLDEFFKSMPYNYVTKYGDEMYGALYMSHVRDDKNTVIISPRRSTRLRVEPEEDRTYTTSDNLYGGTIRSIVPISYEYEQLSNPGQYGEDPAIFSELRSSSDEFTGLFIRSKTLRTDIVTRYGYTEVGHIAGTDSQFRIYNKDEGEPDNYSYLQMYQGKTLIESGLSGYMDGEERYRDTNGVFAVHANPIAGEEQFNTKFVVRSDSIAVEGYEDEKSYIEMGARMTDDFISYSFVDIDRLLIESINGQNYITSQNTATNPYVAIRPGVYTEKLTSASLIRLGSTSEEDNMVSDHPESALDNNISMYTMWEGTDKASTASSLVQKVDGNRCNQISQYFGMFSSNSVGASDGATSPGSDTVKYRSYSNQEYDNPYRDTDTYVRIEPNTITLNKPVGKKSWIKFTTNNDDPESSITGKNTYLQDSGVAIEHRAADNSLYIHGNLGVIGDINAKELQAAYLTAEAAAAGSAKFGRVYNAVYNDYADFVPKDMSRKIEPGDIIAKKPGEDKYTLASYDNRRLVVGVYSDTYGHILGGNDIDDMSKNEKDFIPLAVAGNVYVKVVGPIREGDLITVSNLDGIGVRAKYVGEYLGCIVAKALETKRDEEVRRIKAQVMLM